MKITEVKAIRANRYCYAKVMTDEGIYGIGESGAFGALDASAAQIENFSTFLVGNDPLEIEHLWQAMFRGSYFRGSAVMGELSLPSTWHFGTSQENFTMFPSTNCSEANAGIKSGCTGT